MQKKKIILSISAIFLFLISFSVVSAYYYQETADEISFSAGWSVAHQAPNVYDGDWDTYAVQSGSSSAYVYINYTKPINSHDSTLWQVKNSIVAGSSETEIENLTISQSCWDYNSNKIILRVYSSSILGLSWDCYNGTWNTLKTVSGIQEVYEEAIYWDIAYDIYQEDANETSCSGTWSGEFPCSNVYDGNWSTYGTRSTGDVSVYLNYTKIPNVYDISLFKIKTDDDEGIFNLTIPQSCWDYNESKLLFKGSITSFEITVNANWYCYNGTWNLLRSSSFQQLYEEAVIWRVDTTALNINIIQPLNQCYSTNESLPLNFTIVNVTSLDTCWYNILNSTGGYDVSNTTITDCQNTTFNVSKTDTYTINIYVNESTSGLVVSDSLNFGVSLTAPAIVLDYPANDKYFNNGNNIYYNFTATDPDGIDTCQLWSDWTGTWHNNYTWINPTNATQNFTVVNLTDFSGKWNVWCNDSLGNGGWSISNRTGGVDTVYPLVNITSPLNSSSSEGLALTISYNVSDLNQGTCFFTLRDSNGTIHNYAENTSVTCSESGSRAISTLVYGTYTFQLYGKDKAGNTNSTTITFTNTAPEPGGGGGTAVEVKVVDVVTFARDESLTGAYEILDLAKIYVPFYRECTSRFPDEKCKLENDILVKISNELSLKVGSYNIMDRDKFYEMYLNGNTEVHEVTLDIANEFNLIRDTEGIILLLKPVPPVFDQWWIKEKPWTDEGNSKEYVIKFNKPIKDCQVINGNGNQTYKFECELIVEESGYSNSAIMRITETDDTVFSNSYDTQIMWTAVEKDQNTFQGIKVRMINVGYKSFFTFGVPFIYSIIIYLVLFFIGLAVFINIRSGKKNKWTRFLD